MYMKEETINRNVAHGYLRGKFIRNIRKMVIIKEENEAEEKLRKKMLDDIKKGELKVPV